MKKCLRKVCAMLICVALLGLSMLTVAVAAVDKETVKAVQQALNDAGFDCGTPDGIAGKKTAAAISAYQESNGLEVTGEIDDALLEAMGLLKEPTEESVEETVGETMDEAEDMEQAPEQHDAASSEEIGANDEEDWRDPRVLSQLYNMFFLARISHLGVDYEKEDIGQGDYLINNISDLAGEYILESEKVRMLLGRSELGFWFTDKNVYDELGFLDHAAIVSYLTTVANMFDCVEEIPAIVDLLGEAPSRDGTIPATDYERINYQSSSVEIFGGSEISAVKPAIHLENDDAPEVPEEIAQLTGGIPASIDALAERYPLSGLDTLPEQWDCIAMLADINSGKSHTFPDMGYNWERAEIGILGDCGWDLPLTTSDGQVTATLIQDDDIPDGDYNIIHLFSDDTLNLKGVYTEGESYKEAFIYFVADDVSEEYSFVEFYLTKQTGHYYISIYLNKQGGGYCRWDATYDEAGILSNINYTEKD